MIIYEKDGKSAFKEYAKINPMPLCGDRNKYISWRKACGEWVRENGYKVFEAEEKI